MAPGGYFGRALVVDVTDATTETLPLPDEILRGYIGGAGLGAWLMHRLAPTGVDPLGPDAPIAFCFSPLVGTPLTTSAKFAVVAKSPLTGMLNDALASSHFAIAGKLTGNDAIVVRGACDEPSVLVIDGDGARLEPAGDLWGLSAADAETRLRERLGKAWRVASIGPAGERLVKYATVSHDGRHAGRGGLGAVLGSKLIKAIAVRPSTKVAPADPPCRAGRGTRSARPLVRSRDREVPRARHAGQPARVQRHRHAADPQLPGRDVRGGAGTRRGGPGRGPRRRARQLRLVLDRLRAHLQGRRRAQDARGVRERVRPRPDVRRVGPGCRAGGERPLRRPRSRHHLRRRDDRLGHGVRRARSDRRAVAALRRRGRAPARDRRDRRARGARRAAGRGVPRRSTGRRPGLRGVRAAGEGPGAAGLRAAHPAGDGARAGGQRAGRRPQPVGRLRGRSVRALRPPRGRRAARRGGDRDRGPRGGHGLAHPLQVPARRLRGSLPGMGAPCSAA